MPDEYREGSPSHAPLLVALTVVAALSPFATDSYLAAFPAMAGELSGTPAQIQLTLTAYLAGLGVGTLVLGPVSDGIGRRSLLVVGPLLFAGASVACALSVGLPELTALRVIQGAAVAATVVSARAMVADRFGAATASRQFAIVIAGGHFAPVAAALLGGAALAVGDWRGTFWLMAGVGLMYSAVSLVFLPESLHAPDRYGRSARAVWTRIRTLLTTRQYVLVLVTSLLAVSAHLANVSSSSFIFQSLLGVDRATFILIFAVNSVGMVAANLVYAAFSRRMAAATALRVSLAVALAAAVVLFVGVAVASPTVPFVWACLFVFAACMGVMLSTTVTVGQSAGAPFQGTAAALQGGFNFLAGAAISPVAGLFGANILVALCVIVVVLLGVALLVFSRFHPRELANHPHQGDQQ